MEKIINESDEIYSVSLDLLVKFLQLTEIYMPENRAEIFISKKDVNRPGLPFAGFFGSYEADRIQIVGNAEHKYLKNLDDAKRLECLEKYFATKPRCGLVRLRSHCPGVGLVFSAEGSGPTPLVESLRIKIARILAATVCGKSSACR